MAYDGPVRQWETYWANLEPTVGRELKGDARLVLVISNDGINRLLGIVTVVPLTKLEGKVRKPYPFEVVLPKFAAGNPLDSLVQPFQIRALDRSRLLEPPLGRLTDSDLRIQIEDKLLDHFGISFDSEE